MEPQQSKVAIEGLTYSLFQRPLHPELFEIYASRKIRTDNYQTSIWITGCTYVVSVFVGNDCLSEVIGGPKQLLPKHGLVERFQFRGPRSHKCTVSKKLSYITDFQVEKMSENLYRQSHKDLEQFSKSRGIFVKFPRSSTNNLQPFCYIDFEVRRKELHVHAFAGYPDQVTMIKIQSLFDFS